MFKIALISLLAAFRVAFVGDPQVDNLKELDYARSSIFAELLGRVDLDLVVIMGDLVNDKPALMPNCEAILDSLDCPWIRVQGNHDGKIIPRDTVYKFCGLDFVILNKEDSPMPQPRKGVKTIYCSHYPFKAVVDSSSNALYMSAHLHQVFRERKGEAEHIGVGATCGTWWRGATDEFGIPYALMNCGSPRGYFVVDFYPARKQWYKLDYKLVQRSDAIRCDAHIEEFEIEGAEEGYAARLLVNVFGGSPEGVLKIKIGSRWYKAQNISETDPKVRRIIEENQTRDRAWRRNNRDLYLPMRRISSGHLWELRLKELPCSESLSIRYKDGAMNFRQSLTLR